MSVMLSEGVIVSSPPVEPTPPPAGFSLYPALFSVTCRQAASQSFATQAMPGILACEEALMRLDYLPHAHACDEVMIQRGWL